MNKPPIKPPIPVKLAGVLIAIGLLSWIIMSSGYFPSATDNGSADQPPVAAEAAGAMTNAFSRANWRDVESACRVLLDQDPFHAEARFNLGFSLFRQERFDEAAEHYLQSKDFLEYRDYSFFNLACIYARQNNAESAIEHLKQALENGFTSNRGIEINEDLINLREHPDFESLVDLENENRGTRNNVTGN